MDYQSSTNQPSQKKTTYIALAVIVLILVGVIAWYFSGSQTPSAPSALEQQNPAPAISSGNTTADIANDLNQTLDNSAALNQDFDSLDQEVKSF